MAPMTVAATLIGRTDIERVHAVIAPYIRLTPVVDVDGRDVRVPAGRVALKLELTQRAGSFKARGAFANLLTRQIPKAGVVAASGGNHGAAVAFAAMTLKIPARIFVPTVCSSAKIDQIRSYGVDLVVGGDRYDNTLPATHGGAAESGAHQPQGFDQRGALLDKGTLGLE